MRIWVTPWLLHESVSKGNCGHRKQNERSDSRGIWQEHNKAGENKSSDKEAQGMNDGRVMFSVQLKTEEDSLVALVDADLVFKTDPDLSLSFHSLNEQAVILDGIIGLSIVILISL